MQLCEKVFLEILQHWQENTFARVSFLIKLQALLKKRLWHRCFPVNVVKFLRTPFYRTPLDDCFFITLFTWYNKQSFHDNKNVIRKASFSCWTIHFGNASVSMFMGNCARGSRGSRNCARGSFSSFFCCHIAIDTYLCPFFG